MRVPLELVLLALTSSAWPLKQTSSQCFNDSALVHSLVDDLGSLHGYVKQVAKNLGTRLSRIEEDIGELQENATDVLVEAFNAVLVQDGLKPQPTGMISFSKITDCQDVYDSGQRYEGVYNIVPGRMMPVDVWCKKGWTYIQRRISGLETFDRLWADYKAGFGTADHDYWIGLDNMYAITNQKSYKMRTEMLRDIRHKTDVPIWLEFSKFRIGPSNSTYTLTLDGRTGNWIPYPKYTLMEVSNGAKFSTKDNPNNKGTLNVSLHPYVRSGWWFKDSTYWTSLNSYTRAYGCSANNQVCCTIYCNNGVWETMSRIVIKVKPT